MDVDGKQARMAAFLRDHQEKVVGRWSELVAAGVRGRSSVVEVRRELEEVYSLVLRAMSDADEHAAGELRALLAELVATGAHGVIIDITAVEIVDSFIGRMLTMIGSISKFFDAETVLVRMRPAVAITLTELGLSLRGVRTALNAEKGLALLNGSS